MHIVVLTHLHMSFRVASVPMAPSHCLLACTLIASLLSLLVSAVPLNPPFSAASNVTIFMHSAINITDFVTNTGIPGLGSTALTATAFQFGSMFVFQSPLTATSDPSSTSVGQMQGAGVTASKEGNAFFISSTATLNTTQYSGTLNILGISGGKIPIAGGTDDFLFVQGYSVSTYLNIVGFNITYQIDLYLYWP